MKDTHHSTCNRLRMLRALRRRQNRAAQRCGALPLTGCTQYHGETGNTELGRCPGLMCLAVTGGVSVRCLGCGVIPGVLQAVSQALIDLGGSDCQVVVERQGQPCSHEGQALLGPSESSKDIPEQTQDPC